MQSVNFSMENKKSPILFQMGLFYCFVVTSLPQIYPILIINDLYLHGTKMFPQFE